jgi:hypothetical protein
MKLKLMLLSCSSLLMVNAYAQNQKVDPATCNKLIPQIKQQADACLKIKDQSQRQQCFDKIGQMIQKSAPNGGCDQALNPLKQEYMSKERQLYPSQGSAIGGSNGSGGQQGQPGQPNQMGGQQQGQPNQMGGQQPGQPNQMGGQQQGQPNQMGGQPGQPNQMGGQQQQVPAAVCEKLPQTIKPKAEECLKIKEQPARSQCFDKIGQEIQKVAPNGGCDKALEPLKREIMAKENQMYPKQAPSIK